MKHAACTVGAMAAIVFTLIAQSAVALWRSSPEVVDTARTVYHTVIGVCKHVFTVTATDAITLAAFGIVAGGLVVLLRFVQYAGRRWRQTRRRLALTLAARVAHWPPDLTAVAARLQLANRVDLVDDAAPFAFCYGLFSPRICLSTGLTRLLTPAELEAVLLHEDHHRRRRDPLVLLMTSALAHALFFVPVLRDLHSRFDAAKEFDADAAAVRRHGDVGPLAGALYKVLSYASAGPDLSAAIADGLSVTERRIDHLVGPHDTAAPPVSRRRLAMSALSLSAIAFPLLAVSAVHIQPLVHACRL